MTSLLINKTGSFNGVTHSTNLGLALKSLGHQAFVELCGRIYESLILTLRVIREDSQTLLHQLRTV